MKDFLAEADFPGAVSAGLGCEAGADGVADAFVEEDGKGGSGGDYALGAHASLGEAEVQGKVALAGDFPVGLDHLVESGDLAGDDDVVFRQAQFQSGGSAGNGAFDECFTLDFVAGERVGSAGIVIHLPSEDVGVEAAGVDPDADGFIEVTGHFDESGEVLVVAGAPADVARVDPEFGQRACAVGVGAEEAVAYEVEVADEGDVATDVVEAFADLGNGVGGGIVVDGHAYELGAGVGEEFDLSHGGVNVGGVGVGHGLDDYLIAAAYRNATYGDQLCRASDSHMDSLAVGATGR